MNTKNLIKELQFKAIRSSGAGGQHVNKVSSKIELTFNVKEAISLSEIQKERIQEKLSNKINKENILTLFCDESRSQHRNKEIAIKRFLQLISDALKRQKIRKATKPSKSSILKKAENKKKISQKKKMRKKPNIE